MKKSLLLFGLALGIFFTACDEDDDQVISYNVPEISTSTYEVEEGLSVDVSFDVTADAGYSSSSVSATNGSAEITSTPAAGATSGTVTVTFTASDAGAGSVVLSVVDAEGQTSTSTAVITIAAELTEIEVTDNITENTTWEYGKTYILTTRIAVEEGATLTIEPGVIVKGEAGTGTSASALIIARGADIVAEGTADLPIIFTSVADEIDYDDIEAGNFASPNLDSETNGLWGGLIVLGYAPVSVSGDGETAQIEGIPTSDSNGLYGGSDASDASGSLKYISIRHGGTNIGEGNEINGLSLGGVGTGTEISHIEIVSNQDDGIEFFGGSVSVSDVVVWNVGDDGLDTDQAWTGNVDNFVVITSAGHCFELDGPEGSLEGAHSFTNGYVVATSYDSDGEVDRFCEDLVNADANSAFSMSNVYFTSINDQTIDADVFDVATLSNIVLNVEEADLLSYLEDQTEVPASITAGTTNTVDFTAFTWTWANEAGVLD